jgi:hypothetical protein
MSAPEYPLLVVDTSSEPGESDPDDGDSESPVREFRSLPSEIETIAANISIANLLFEEFAESARNCGTSYSQSRTFRSSG